MSYELAIERIRTEAKQKIGVLDIDNLGLDHFPDELFELTHLQNLF